MENQLANINRLEKDLWEAADNLRANSKLTSTEYCMPVLGVIFLRHASNRFDAVTEEIKASGLKRKPVKADYVKRRSLFLPEESRYDYLLSLPTDQDLGEAIIAAMEKIEESFEPLAGVLPKEYTIFDATVLEDLVRIFDSEAMKTASGDVFGRIYEYFLMKFAMQGAQDNGEFFTPPSLVQTIVNVIEPMRGVVLDPAVGSAGMFVQSSHFVEAMGQDAAHNLTFYGQEKTATTIRLAKMNLAVHGLEGDIVEANTFYQDEHSLVGQCDYVMANPPFNVDMVDAEKVKGDVRLPFGLPGVNKKKKVSNGNYLWIQYFYSYLNETGRSGFVMATGAENAGADEQVIRERLLETGHVDALIAIDNNFFYTRQVSCVLWFLDKGKPQSRHDHVLLIDARHIHRKVTRIVKDFSPEQLANITALVWLYREESDRYLTLIREYLVEADKAAIAMKEPLLKFVESMDEFVMLLNEFGKSLTDSNGEDSDAISEYGDAMVELAESMKLFRDGHKETVDSIDSHAEWISTAKIDSNKQQLQAHDRFEPVSQQIRSLRKLADHVIRSAAHAYSIATKSLSATKSEHWKTTQARSLHKELVRTPKEDDEDNLRVWLFGAFRQPTYLLRQVQWLQSKFPDAKFRDVEGLCKSVPLKEVKENDWSLTPGRYVGDAPTVSEEDDIDFDERMLAMQQELSVLNSEAHELAEAIDRRFSELLP